MRGRTQTSRVRHLRISHPHPDLDVPSLSWGDGLPLRPMRRMRLGGTSGEPWRPLPDTRELGLASRVLDHPPCSGGADRAVTSATSSDSRRREAKVKSKKRHSRSKQRREYRHPRSRARTRGRLAEADARIAWLLEREGLIVGPPATRESRSPAKDSPEQEARSPHADDLGPLDRIFINRTSPMVALGARNDETAGAILHQFLREATRHRLNAKYSILTLIPYHGTV